MGYPRCTKSSRHEVRAAVSGSAALATVHIGGAAPVRSCQTPISAAENGKITTIEGLSPDGSHPVQLAWADLGRAAMRLLPGGTDDVGRSTARQNAQA